MEEISNKLRLLRIWEILKKETDEEHPMPSSTIIKRLQSEGLKCKRQTLYDDIEVLNKNGYEVLCKRAISNEYYVLDRDFDVAEIQILMDAVQSANFITAKKTELLIDKLSALAGTQQGEIMKNGIIHYDSLKGNNEAIFYFIYEIATALKNGKKIGFYYGNHDISGAFVRRKEKDEPTKDKWYVVNPVDTVEQDGKYYLICYDDKHGKLTQYRIDRMESVKMIEDDITPNKERSTKEIVKHKQSLIGMYGGRKEQVSFVAKMGVLDSVYDKFGTQIKPYLYGNDQFGFTAEVQIGKPFLTWVIGFGNALKVTSPASVVEEIKALLKEATENYD